MWRYFLKHDFACKHCGQNKTQDDFISKVDRLRETVGFPLVVTSGYRCPVHNAAVSRTGESGPHTSGRAVDLAVDRGKAFIVLKAALASGEFTGIGIQQKGGARFIHLDDLREPEHAPRPTVWSY